MAETHQVVTKVWIAPGCIVCDSCENDCPEVFEVQEATCIIRPPAMNAEFLKPITQSIITAMEGCPVEVIKIETVEVAGPAPWANQPEPAAGAGAEVVARAPAAKIVAPMAAPDPKWQALFSNSKISPSLSAGLATTIRKSPEVVQAEEMFQQVNLPKDAPADQKMAMLAVGGACFHRRNRWPIAFVARPRLRAASAVAILTSSSPLAGSSSHSSAQTAGAMLQDFFGPKVLKEPKKLYRVGKLEEFGNPGVYEQYKPNNIWVVNLQPSESRLVALNTVCTHLGCIPNWLSADQKFKCPCHGSGYYITGVNFEGPTPRPLERFAVYKDADGFVWVDQTKIFRSELGQWDDSESFVALS